MWSALKDGQIDMVVSDHSPCTPDLKNLGSGDFTKAWGGISSLQFGNYFVKFVLITTTVIYLPLVSALTTSPLPQWCLYYFELYVNLQFRHNNGGRGGRPSFVLLIGQINICTVMLVCT